MTPRLIPVAIAAVSAAVAAGCGLGEGETSDGVATLTVTRDYGAESLVEAQVEDPPESETVMRALDREADIETRYGGGFVQSIGGIESRFGGGRSFDWFFFVNGMESEVGAAEFPLRGGDRAWWDYRDWSAAMRVPAVVGSWPEPFRQASAGVERNPVVVECAGSREPCAAVEEALAGAGVNSAIVQRAGEVPDDALRILVGTAAAVALDEAAEQISRGPRQSGVFARFGADRIELLDERGQAAGSASALVAATRVEDGSVVWLVTGVEEEDVSAAAGLLSEDVLRNRYAVASTGGQTVAIPTSVGEEGG